MEDHRETACAKLAHRSLLADFRSGSSFFLVASKQCRNVYAITI